MSKVALFIGRQEMVVAKVTVVQHVRTITEVYIQVGQLKIAIHCSCLGVAQQACHTLELVGAVAVARGEEQPVSLLMLHFASPATKKRKYGPGGGLRPPPGPPRRRRRWHPGHPPLPLPSPPPPSSPPPKKRGGGGEGGEGGGGGRGRGGGGGKGGKNLPDKTKVKSVWTGTCLPGQIVCVQRDFVQRCDDSFVTGKDI